VIYLILFVESLVFLNICSLFRMSFNLTHQVEVDMVRHLMRMITSFLANAEKLAKMMKATAINLFPYLPCIPASALLTTCSVFTCKEA